MHANLLYPHFVFQALSFVEGGAEPWAEAALPDDNDLRQQLFK